jgi:hypothetical protein
MRSLGVAISAVGLIALAACSGSGARPGISGSLADPEISVAIPCPELSRPAYSSASGSLQSFEQGAVHRLELVRHDTSLPARASDPVFSEWYLLRADPVR